MNSQRAARGVKESLREGWMTQIIQERPKSGLKRKNGANVRVTPSEVCAQRASPEWDEKITGHSFEVRERTWGIFGADEM